MFYIYILFLAILFCTNPTETVIAGQPDTNTGTMTQVWLKIPCFIVAYHHVPSEKAKVGDRHTRTHIYIIYVYVCIYIYVCVPYIMYLYNLYIYIYDIPNCQTHPNGCWENLPKQKTQRRLNDWNTTYHKRTTVIIEQNSNHPQ